jgi:hypothetical protein
MKTKVIYICIAVILLAGLFYFGWRGKNSRLAEPQKQETTKETSEIPKLDLTQALQKFEESIKKDYKVVAYNKSFDDKNHENNVVATVGRYKVEVDNTGDLFEGTNSTTFSIFKDGKLANSYDNNFWGRILEVGNLKLNNTDYYILQSFNGGASCCFTWQALAHENSILHIGEKLDLKGSGEQLSKYYFEKDGQLYFLMYDSSFADFHTSHAGSVWFPVFYKIDSQSGNFVLSNNEFEKYYRQLSGDMNIEIEKAKLDFPTKIDFSLANDNGPTDAIFSSLTHRLIIRILANQDIEIAKEEFINDSNFFFKDGIIEGKKADGIADEVANKFVPKSETKKLITKAPKTSGVKVASSNLTYNQVFNSAKKRDESANIYIGKVIKWKAKISAYYSQIDGIKFCVVDKDHLNVNIYESCDWFWAFSDGLMDGNNLEKNPSWDGHWVPYTLNYYSVPFNKNSRYYNDIYTVTGKIDGASCGEADDEFPDYDCILDVDILGITK